MKLSTTDGYIRLTPETTNEAIEVGKMFMHLRHKGVDAKLSAVTSWEENQHFYIPIIRNTDVDIDAFSGEQKNVFGCRVMGEVVDKWLEKVTANPELALDRRHVLSWFCHIFEYGYNRANEEATSTRMSLGAIADPPN